MFYYFTWNISERMDGSGLASERAKNDRIEFAEALCTMCTYCTDIRINNGRVFLKSHLSLEYEKN